MRCRRTVAQITCSRQSNGELQRSLTVRSKKMIGFDRRLEWVGSRFKMAGESGRPGGTDYGMKKIFGMAAEDEYTSIVRASKSIDSIYHTVEPS